MESIGICVPSIMSRIVDYNRENCLPGCMMILGTDNFSIYLNE